MQLVEASKLFVIIYLSFYGGENRWSYFLDNRFGSNFEPAIDRRREDLSNDITFIIWLLGWNRALSAKVTRWPNKRKKLKGRGYNAGKSQVSQLNGSEGWLHQPRCAAFTLGLHAKG